ncbi:uncharacterized protein LOC130895070 isoform X2 [Diorhabda carinulata]|uniref:uncharacterized protein LOC130895070 isoform X2 n=1 Tax=Diorhabda carinulata TaxID=1163345 RepID=UPI0025A0B571|nr:uncharacterized protein LOC130895070 isoform X2 [Diorhabda carinulata]
MSYRNKVILFSYFSSQPTLQSSILLSLKDSCNFIFFKVVDYNNYINRTFTRKIPKSIETINAGVRDLKPMNENGLPILMNQFGYVTHEIPIDIKSESLFKRIDAIKECMETSDIVTNFMVWESV